MRDSAQLSGPTDKARRMRRFATGLLVFMAVAFVLLRHYAGPHPAWGYALSFTEAAMVGGLADWFAVTALFRHPLGLPIPHTAIIPENKDRIASTMAAFLRDNFLTPQVVARRMRGYNVAASAGRYFTNPESGAQSRLLAGAANLMGDMLESLDQRQLGGMVKSALRTQLDKLEIACLDGERVGVDLTGLKAARHALRKAVLRAAILDEKLWSEPDQAILHPKLSSHIRLVSRLAGNRQPGQAAPWAFTTNYDLALEWSAEALGLHCVNGFSGTHDRTFRPSSFDLGLRNVQARGEARFGTYNLYLGKLHGSISWTASKSGSVCELPSASVKPLVDQFIASDESDDWPGFMIFPGASKFVLRVIGSTDEEQLEQTKRLIDEVVPAIHAL